MRKFYLVSAALLFFIQAFSQAGSFDPLFGAGGRVHTNILDLNRGGELFEVVVVQPDGRILAAGNSLSPGIIFRFNTDGSLDNSFGTGGIAYVFGYKFSALALQPDGKIVAGGGNYTIIRLNANGSVDNSFGTGGQASAPIGQYDILRMVKIQDDGKIVLGGISYTGSHDQISMVRFNSDGSPDNGFDGDGKLLGDASTSVQELWGMAIQNDGKIIISGEIYTAGVNYFAVNRYNANGTLDNSFDEDGQLTTSFGTNDDYGRSVAVQNDGKIVVTGFSGSHLAIARYNSNGTLDNSFDGDGKLVISDTWVSSSRCPVALQPDGKILVTLSTDDVAVYRFNSNGTFDNSFDGDGRASMDFGTVDRPRCIALQTDGKIVVGGSRDMPSQYDYILARFNANGSPDNSFDGDGKITGYFPVSYDLATAMTVQNDGKIILVGYTSNIDLGNNNDFAIARYNANGTLDNSFDGDGIVSTAVSLAFDDRAQAVAVQSDGKILVAGRSRFSTSSYDIALLRYNTDGSPDNSFDGDGKAIFIPTTGNDNVTAIVLQSDGKILLNGPNLLMRVNTNGTLDNSFDGDGIITTTMGGTVAMLLQTDGKIVIGGNVGGDFALARYNSNGTPDNSFDGDGFLTTDINSSGDALLSIALQSDGKIVAAGMAGSDFALVRYTTNGSLDNSFSGDGKLITTIDGTNAQAVSVAIQSNGKIILAGENRNASFDFVLVRYNIDGTVDNSFDGDGKAYYDLYPGSNDHLVTMKLYSNRIYLAGQTTIASGNDFALAAMFSDDLMASLPLQILDFAAKLPAGDALLNWKTEHENNNLMFNVERSSDGQHFTPIGSINSRNTGATDYYGFTDFNVGSLNVPFIYYRLNLVNKDGAHTYSRIIALPIAKNKTTVLFYPNPVINEASLTVTVSLSQKVQVRIIDNKGAIVKQLQRSLASGSTSFPVDVSALPAGIYYLELKGETIDFSKQFIK